MDKQEEYIQKCNLLYERLGKCQKFYVDSNDVDYCQNFYFAYKKCLENDYNLKKKEMYKNI